ncbi:MAG TPA: aminodeoxychorismate synthase component I [Gemmatimonadales bacterium]|nr:aminodeoxychorismate synthase component I [Gemmatimonadales bacterium]
MSRTLPLVHEIVPAPEPLDVCARLSRQPFLVFLDSARRDARLGRYSFIAADPIHLIRSKGALTLERPSGRSEWKRVSDPLGAARAVLRRFEAEPVADLPPFQGGAAGYLGYDWGTTLERVPRARYDDLEIPDVMLGIYDWVIAWDHAAGRAWIISTGMPERGAGREARAASRLALVRQYIGQPVEAAGPSQPAPGHEPARVSAPSFAVKSLSPRARVRSNFTRAGYEAAVRHVVEYIRAGDIFQANLSQRFQAPLIGTALELYQRLRSRNPAPFAAYLAFDDVRIASSSPERFLRVGHGQVEARPIKGTRPRGTGPEHDAALARALHESAKDRAENVMIVDLLRNDLSRVCRPASVHVPELFALEQYATVHHLVSTVVGELEPEHDIMDLLRASFPGGSITGAPKIRAMQIIAELEPTQRTVYCGAIGYVSLSHAADTSIAIRTMLVRGDEVYFQAGGGIVADSEPELEYEETLDKAAGMIEALVP